MLKYISKRILIFIPTLIAISLLTFVISINAPGDPVEFMLAGGSGGGEGTLSDRLAGEKAYNEIRHKLGLDLPIFYFSFSNLGSCDTLYKFREENHRETLRHLLHQYGNWSYISKYYHFLKQLELQLLKVEKDATNAQALIQMKSVINELFLAYDNLRISSLFVHMQGLFNKVYKPDLQNIRVTAERERIDILFQSSPHLYELKHMLYELRESYYDLIFYTSRWKTYIPIINFYGLNNQYHRWMFGDKPWLTEPVPGSYTSAGFVRGDFGISYQDARPVSSVLWDALRWTLLISFISIFITYIIAIPVGVSSAVNKGTLKDQVVTTGLFILYSLPNFWIATILIMFLGGGDFLNWFPAFFDVGNWAEDATMVDKILDTAYQLVLPLVCWTYPTFAFISRQMRGGMLNVLNQDYIRTARSKGLAEGKVIWKHALRNSLLPIITLFANVFPLAIGGSVVLEFIFSIPGMGKLAFEAIFARNYPIVLSVVMFASILTMLGYLIADILYAVVDPRISYSSKGK